MNDRRADVTITLWRQDHPAVPYAFTVATYGTTWGNSSSTLADALAQIGNIVRDVFARRS